MLRHSYIRKSDLRAIGAPPAHALQHPAPKKPEPAPKRAVPRPVLPAQALPERFRLGPYANGPP
jgi:hypothetical protein